MSLGIKGKNGERDRKEILLKSHYFDPFCVSAAMHQKKTFDRVHSVQ